MARGRVLDLRTAVYLRILGPMGPNVKMKVFTLRRMKCLRMRTSAAYAMRIARIIGQTKAKDKTYCMYVTLDGGRGNFQYEANFDPNLCAM